MKILQLVDNFYPTIGGAQYVAGELAKAQVARGDEVQVVATGPRCDLPETDSWDGIPVHRLEFRAALEQRDIEKLISVRNRMRELRQAIAPEITHVHLWGPGAALHMQTNQAAWSPWIVTVHAPVPKPIRGAVDNVGNILRAASAIAAVSDYSRQNILAHTGPDSKVSLIYNAIRDSGRSYTPLPWHPPVLLCMGRSVPEKGFDVAIEALAKIHASVPGARLVITGDGPERSALEFRAQELGVSNQTEFLGWVPAEQLPSVLDRSTIVLVPSRGGIELFGLVAAEAALAGRPVVAAKTGGLTEVVLHGKTGLLVPVDDARALAEAVVGLLGDQGLTEQLGLQAAESARDRFGLERLLTSYDELYQQMLIGVRGES